MDNGKLALRCAAVPAIVGGITLVFVQFVPVNATTVGFTYLVAILFIAARWGLVESTLGSVLAVLCFNFFFLPPVGTLTIADPQNWVALLAFMVTAITASRLSVQAQRRTDDALERQAEMERLYALSRAILLIDPAQPVHGRLTTQIAQILGVASVTLFDRESGQFHRSGTEEFPGIDDQLRQAAMQGTQFRNDDHKIVIAAIRLGSQPIASLGISGTPLSDSALQSLTNLVAIGLERARAQEAASRAEASRQSEQLKSMLLDAIAHEFQTPLTSIKASTTALLSDRQPQPQQQREFIKIVDEETVRLSGLVDDAIQMARVDAGRVQLHRERWPVEQLIQSVLEKMKPRLGGRDLSLNIAEDLPNLPADRELVGLALRQLLSNATKYSPPDAPIGVSATAQDGKLLIQISDHGPGILAEDRARVFERFYRSPKMKAQIPGAGLGLAIARDVVRAHSGEIWVDSTPGGGSTFCISLPLLSGEESV
ncbi:MAG: ATP-binding protein [Acidobacteriota bacterium]